MREPFGLGAVPGIVPKAGTTKLGFNIRKQFADGKLLQILRIKPFELVAVEDGVGAADARERKAADQIRGAQKFFIRARGPAEEREEIAKRFGKKSFLGVGTDARCAVTLREARAIRAEDQGDVSEDRRRCAQGFVKQRLLGRIREMIGAANDVRDAHVDVVYDDAKLIGWQAGGAQ